MVKNIKKNSFSLTIQQRKLIFQILPKSENGSYLPGPGVVNICL